MPLWCNKPNALGEGAADDDPVKGDAAAIIR